MLITFDVPGVGQMEAEFMMAGKELGFHLYCPESYIGIFESLVPEFRNIMEEHGYKASGIEVEAHGPCAFPDGSIQKSAV